MKDCLHILKHCIYLIVTYCQKVPLNQPQFIEHNFLFKNSTLQSKIA